VGQSRTLITPRAHVVPLSGLRRSRRCPTSLTGWIGQPGWTRTSRWIARSGLTFAAALPQVLEVGRDWPNADAPQCLRGGESASRCARLLVWRA